MNFLLLSIILYGFLFTEHTSHELENFKIYSFGKNTEENDNQRGAKIYKITDQYYVAPLLEKADEITLAIYKKINNVNINIAKDKTLDNLEPNHGIFSLQLNYLGNRRFLHFYSNTDKGIRVNFLKLDLDDLKFEDDSEYNDRYALEGNMITSANFKDHKATLIDSVYLCSNKRIFMISLSTLIL